MFTGMFSRGSAIGWIAQRQEMISDPEYKIGCSRRVVRRCKRSRRGAYRPEKAEQQSDLRVGGCEGRGRGRAPESPGPFASILAAPQSFVRRRARRRGAGAGEDEGICPSRCLMHSGEAAP